MNGFGNLGILGTLGSRLRGIGGADIGSVFRLMSSSADAATKQHLMGQALQGNLVWGDQQPVSRVSTLTDPIGPSMNPNVSDPKLNPLMGTISQNLANTKSPFDASFYAKAASATGYTNSGNKGLYQMSSDQWNRYGSGDMQDTNSNISAYINMSNDTYQQLQTKLGRPPTQYEVYMGNTMGVDAAHRLLITPRDTMLDPSLVGGYDLGQPQYSKYTMSGGTYNNVGTTLNNYQRLFV